MSTYLCCTHQLEDLNTAPAAAAQCMMISLQLMMQLLQLLQPSRLIAGLDVRSL